MTKPVGNFGGNVSFAPGLVVEPRTEAELLNVMRQHRGRPMRAIGSLHSWSHAVVTPDVLVDVRHLNDVTVVEGDAPYARVGAGCRIKRLLAELNARGYTMPTLGLITEQTIAGASATGTHGSGRNSISHYIQSVRVACYDPTTGEPVIHTIEAGEELRAARCGLGALGIVVSVRVPIRRQYQIEEHFRRYAGVESVLAAEEGFPLQQFYLTPWRWDFYAQHRREVDRPRSWHAPLYRAYWSLGMDRAFHFLVIGMARRLPAFCTRLFYRRLIPILIPQRWKVVDRSDRQLTMAHHLYRHIEIEVFVRKSRLKEALAYFIWLLRHAGGERAECDPEILGRLQAAGQWGSAEQLGGQYLHHYPICIRKVLPDDTLLSMAGGGDEPWYAVSFISYVRPQRRSGFLSFAKVLAVTAARLFGARPHWGKVCPLEPNDLRELYPHMDRFAAIRRAFDPDTIFGNPWLDAMTRSGDTAPHEVPKPNETPHPIRRHEACPDS